LTLPRELIDSTKSDGTDDKFIVLVDETFAAETEKKSSSLTRTILISLVSGNKQVEIIGTHLGTITLTFKNNTLSVPSLITTPAKSAEQKPIENKTNQQTLSQPITLQSTSTISQAKSVQEQLLQQITSLVHFKSGYLPLDMGEKQIVEYSVIGAIILVVIIVIASSIRSKNKKPVRK
jgi:hypothetical protein